MNFLKIKATGGKGHELEKVELDGKDIRQDIKSITLHMGPGRIATAKVEFIVNEIDVDVELADADSPRFGGLVPTDTGEPGRDGQGSGRAGEIRSW